MNLQDLLVVMPGVVVKQDQLLDIRVARNANSLFPSAVTPASVGWILLRCVLGVVDQDVSLLAVLANDAVCSRVAMLVVARQNHCSARRFDAVTAASLGMVERKRTDAETADPQLFRAELHEILARSNVQADREV